MGERTWVQRNGLTPVKGGLIGVLAIVLISVVVGQFVGTGEAEHSAKKSAAAAPKRPLPRIGRAPIKTRPVAAHVPRVAKQRRPWSRVTVEEVVQFNPLRLPAALANDARNATQQEAVNLAGDEQLALAQRRHEVLARLQNAGVSTIVLGQHGNSAYIGDEFVREGDVIHGFVVERIDRNGVQLADPQSQ